MFIKAVGPIASILSYYSTFDLKKCRPIFYVLFLPNLIYKIVMKIAFTYNLKTDNSEDQAEFDTKQTVDALSEAMSNLGHQVEHVEVSGPPSQVMAKLESLNPDLVFNTAEGKYGRYREAFYPGLFEQLGLPFTGSDAYLCNLTLDKDLTKKVVAELGVPVPTSQQVTRIGQLNEKNIRFPVILKPNFEGSSKGITQESIAENLDELKEKLKVTLKKYPAGILVEEFVVGKDITIGFVNGINNDNKGVLVPTEYHFAAEYSAGKKYQIYDYHLKNSEADKVSLRTPAELDPKTTQELIKYAQKIFTQLDIKDIGRVDFRVTPDNRIYFIEINALPSLEPGAGIYQAAALFGHTKIEDVLDAIINSASKRFNIRPQKSLKKNLKKLRIGFSYNEKRIIPQSNPLTDIEAEYDAPKTLDAIRSAIASYGHEVVDLEATPELPANLISANIDLVFNIAEGIKGRYRESQVPALLDLMGIEYTGSDASTMALTLDKGLAKRIVREAGVKTPNFLLFITGKEPLPKDFKFPVVIKPVAEGSSKGLNDKSVVHNEKDLREEASAIIARYKQGALAEEYLPGREFTVAVIGEKRPQILPPMEIVFTPEAGNFHIYSYHHKLDVNSEVKYDVPAKIDEKLRNQLEQNARKVFNILDCRDIARIDFRLDAEGNVNFVECNPLPGLTPGWSDLCLIAESTGMTYRELIGEIIAPAIRRYKQKMKTLLHKDKNDAQQSVE